MMLTESSEFQTQCGDTMGCLYIIEGPKNYIGITSKDAEVRWSQHIKQSEQKRTRRSYLINAMKFHGLEKFKIRTLVVAADWAYLCELERRAIASFGTKSPLGYNSTDGGDGVPGMDAETRAVHRAKTSEGTKEAWSREDYQASRAAGLNKASTKARMSETTRANMKRLYETEEFRSKIKASRADPDYRKRVSVSLRALWATSEYRSHMTEKRRLRPPRSEASKKDQSERMKRLISERKASGTYNHGNRWASK